MKKKINIGVLGCANIAERFVIPTIIELKQCFNLIGVSSRTEKKANEFAHKFNINTLLEYDSLLNMKDIEAVYIPLPNSLHYQWVKKSLEKGLHVIVEKTLACNYCQVIELNNIAQKNDLVLIENFQFRFHSQLIYIKNIIENGRIGELRNVRSSFSFPPFKDKKNIRYNKELGGGALLDAGAYTLMITQLFLGDDISVNASSLSIDDSDEVDIWGSAYIKQNNGPLASQVAFGFDNYYQCNLELLGSKGKITAERIFTAPPDFKPIIRLETENCTDKIELDSDHHFINMFVYFYKLITNKYDKKNEYKININQARLVQELLEKASE